MPLMCKQRALYVKGCAIPNGITDSQGDTLYAEDIKKIFTSFNNQDNFEILHDDLPLQEVSLLENYISTADESIGNLVVPAGSWNVVIRVDNPEIQERLLTGELGGLSLSNRIAPKCKGNLKGTVRYKDVADKECVIPKFISFVERGANGYGLHIYDYDAYILKSKDIEFEEENGGHIMDFKEFLTGLKSLIKAEVEVTEEVEETEAEEEDEPTVEKEETVEEEEEKAVIEKEDEPADESEEEAEVVATEAENDLEARVAKLEEIIAKLTAEKEEEAAEEESTETPDPEEEPEDEDTPKITKSEKVIIEDTTTAKVTNYYEMSGRDPLTGKKLRN